MNRDETLTTAATLINGDRAKAYGDAAVNFQRIADLWTAQFRHKLTQPFTAADVALGLTHLKLSRIANTPDHADSFIDAAGYLALGAELATSDTGTPEPETSPAKPPSRAPDDGLRVGARVRVRETCVFRTGGEGEIVSKASSDKFDWDVHLDGYRFPREFNADELEVIEHPENMCAIEGRHTHDGTGTETTHEGPHT